MIWQKFYNNQTKSLKPRTHELCYYFTFLKLGNSFYGGGKTSPLFSICNQLKFYTTIQNQFTFQINLLFTILVSKSSAVGCNHVFFHEWFKVERFWKQHYHSLLSNQSTFFKQKDFKFKIRNRPLNYFSVPQYNPNYF